LRRAVASLYLERRPDDFAVAILSSPMHEPNTGRISDHLACRVVDLKLDSYEAVDQAVSSSEMSIRRG
jgi:alpha-beta hydrolase superfamily lysophospholipase